MVVNKAKLVAAAFIIAGSVMLFFNDLEFTPLILILKSIGLVLFIRILIKEQK